MAKAGDDSDSDHEDGIPGHSQQQQQQHFRAGTVTRVHRDGTFLVEYAIGQAEKHVSLGRLYRDGSAAHVLTSSSMSGGSSGGASSANGGVAAAAAGGGVGGQTMPNGMKKPMLTRMGRWVGKAAGLIQRSDRSRSRSKSQDKYAPSSGGSRGGVGAGGGNSGNENNCDSNGGEGGGMLLTAEGLKQHTATAASLHRMSVTSPAVTHGDASASANAPAVEVNCSSQPSAPAPPETLRRRPKAGRAAFKGAATTAAAAAGSGGAAGAEAEAEKGATTGEAGTPSGSGNGDPSSLTTAEIEAEYVRGCALLEVSSNAAAAAEAFETASSAGHFQATTKLGLLFAYGHPGDESE